MYTAFCYEEIDPLFLTMPDNRYWALGKYVGDAWNVGMNLIHSHGDI